MPTDELIEEQPVESRIMYFEQELKKLLEKCKLGLSTTIDFPIYKQLPPEASLAMEVLKRHGAVFVSSYKDMKGVPPDGTGHQG